MCFFLAETPIEEFTPTPAFPALQYLESVDVEGVAWRAGLRTGDFLIEVIKDSTSLASSSSLPISLLNTLLMEQIKKLTTAGLCILLRYICGHDIVLPFPAKTVITNL